MQKICIFLISLYQRYISPLLGNHCRFYPSCSEYAKHSIRERGLWRGLYKAGIRILKCNPTHPGGYDPVQQGTERE